MTLDYSNRAVVVAGGTGSLGAAVVQMLLDAGASVFIPAHRSPDPAHDIPWLKHARVKIVAPVDLGDEHAVESFYESLPSLWASVHTVGGFTASPIETTSLSDMRKMMDVNAMTCFLACREAARKIRRTAAAGGRIVNVAARPAVIPTAGLAAYAASKAAVVSLTTTLAEELAADRIWVNAVLPSTMDTPANRAAMPNADFSKWPKVEDVAATIAFLASPQNAVTRQALVPVYGQS